MSIGILHGYLLEGSGSNLWTRAIARALCRQGDTVHLVCQEPHPEDYDFISGYVRYEGPDQAETIFERDTGYPGRCVMHRPVLGDTLPVYVHDRYEEFERVVPMVELPDAEIESYIERNAAIVDRIVEQHELVALHANHAVLMSVVAQRVGAHRRVPFAIMPHGSAIEYAVKCDERFLRYAADAFDAAARVFVIGKEMTERVQSVLGEHVPGLGAKLVELNLGVDTSLFRVAGPDEKRSEIEQLEEALAPLERGRTAAQERTLRDHLETQRPTEIDAFRAAIEPDAAYDLKAPDAALEDKLAAIDWASDPVILFVGRLIANKGPQAVLAAAPSVLGAAPDARFVFVGHGPLREPLEAMAWALEQGELPLLRRIAGWGTALEDGPARPFGDVLAYLDRLEEERRLAEYVENARRHVSPERIVFTGYLTHTELRHVFACADAAVFPSRIREAGPLVFLEALASGCCPVGTDFGGMAASIDAVEEALGADATRSMRLDPDEAELVSGIERSLPGALETARRRAPDLRRLAVERYDWTNVARRLADALAEMG